MSMGLATEWKEVPFKATSASPSTTSMPIVQLLGAEAVLIMVLDSQLLTMLLKTFYGNKNILREK